MKIDSDMTFIQGLIDKPGDVIMLSEPDGKVSLVNQAYTQMLGYPTEDLLNRRPEGQEHFFTQEDKQKAVEIINKVLQGEEATQEVVYRHKDGRPIYTRITGRPLELNGRAMALWTITDLAELAESRDFASTLFSNLPLPASLLTPEGVRVDVNEAATKLYKRGKEEWIGAELEQMYEEADVPGIRKAIEDCKKIGHSSCEATAIRGDRTKFPTILEFSTLKDKEGNITHIIGTATDVTELQKREKELEDAKAYIENLMEVFPAQMTVSTPEGKRIQVNNASEQFFRRSKEEIINLPLERLYEEKEKVKATFEEAKKTGFASCEVTLLRGDGSKAPILILFAPLRDKEGNVINILSNGTDLTEIHQREEELDEARARLEGIITSIADALCVVDDKAKWLTTNPAMTRLTGYSEEELLGKKTPEQPFCQLPEAEQAIKDMWGKIQAGEIASGIEIPWVRKDGIKVIVSCSEQALKDAQGNVIGRVFIARDVTELKKAAQEVAQALGTLSRGDLTRKVDVSGLSGDLKEMGESINKSIDSLDMLIGGVTQAVGALAEGDLTRKVDVSGLSGDLKEMGESINKSIDSLDMLIGETKNTAQMVSSTSQSLSASAEELSASTNQISGTVAQIAQGATDQASHIERVRKTTVDLRELSTRGASEANSAAKETTRAAEEALMGSRAAQEAIDRTSRIFNVTSDSASVVKSLGELIEEIGATVEVVTSIADQTNLLSLNAAIEAARAGEQGRAFAVVAGEVKKLAQESKESAKRITSMVKKIESERAKAVSSMDLGLKEVTEGGEVINKALNALDKIASLVQELAGMSQTILEVNRKQEEATEMIGKTIGEISAVAEQNAAGAEETSASTEEEAASVEELTAAAQELASMAENLDRAVARFKIVETA